MDKRDRDINIRQIELKRELDDEKMMVIEERERLECLLGENEEKNHKHNNKQRNLPR